MQRFLLHPAFCATGWFCALIASFAAAWFYQDTRKGPELAYSVRPLRTIVVDERRPSNLRVFHNGKEMAAPVTAVEIVLWNKGRHAIHADQVLEPVVLRTGSSCPILDIQTQVPRARTQLGFKADRLMKGEAVLTWRLLAPGDAGVFRILYAGGPETEVYVEGRIAGQREILRIEPPEGTIYGREFNFSSRRVIEIYGWVLILVGLYSLYPLFLVASSSKGCLWLSLLAALAILACVCFVAYGLLRTYEEPPYGWNLR